jgi:ABC-type lipoprotein export system ATPase subunit
MTDDRHPMVSLRGVSKVYEVPRSLPVAALREVDLEVAAGEFLVVTGRSAAGKTTLLNVIAGLSRPTAGAVHIDGRDLWGLSDRRRSQLRSATMGFVFQFPSLLSSLTVLQNVLLPLSLGPDTLPSARDRADELLELVGLGGAARSYPRRLSAGQQQRVVIARALIFRPRLLLADEPSSNLDEQTEAEIMELLGRIHGETGTTVVLVTHAADLVGCGTRHLTMADGAVRPAATEAGRDPHSASRRDAPA